MCYTDRAKDDVELAFVAEIQDTQLNNVGCLKLKKQMQGVTFSVFGVKNPLNCKRYMSKKRETCDK